MIETRQLPAAKIFMLLQSHAPKISNSFILSLQQYDQIRQLSDVS